MESNTFKRVKTSAYNNFKKRSTIFNRYEFDALEKIKNDERKVTLLEEKIKNHESKIPILDVNAPTNNGNIAELENIKKVQDEIDNVQDEIQNVKDEIQNVKDEIDNEF